MKYQDRIIVYIDLLGFKNHIDETFTNGIDNETKIASIIKVIEHLKSIGIYQDNVVVSSYFSDTLVISFEELEKEQITFIIYSIGQLLIGLIGAGFICKGYMTSGKLIHTKEYIFGPALIRAYKAEEETVFYPRVVVDEELIEKGLCKSGNLTITKDYLLSYLQYDLDGLLYIDYFEKIQSSMSLDELIRHCNQLRLSIEQGLIDSRGSLNILAKYGWMRDKFNKMIKTFTSEEYLRLHINEDEELVKQLEKQKQIKNQL